MRKPFCFGLGQGVVTVESVDYRAWEGYYPAMSEQDRRVGSESTPWWWFIAGPLVQALCFIARKIDVYKQPVSKND